MQTRSEKDSHDRALHSTAASLSGRFALHLDIIYFEAYPICICIQSSIAPHRHRPLLARHRLEVESRRGERVVRRERQAVVHRQHAAAAHRAVFVLLVRFKHGARKLRVQDLLVRVAASVGVTFGEHRLSASVAGHTRGQERMPSTHKHLTLRPNPLQPLAVVTFHQDATNDAWLILHRQGCVAGRSGRLLPVCSRAAAHSWPPVQVIEWQSARTSLAQDATNYKIPE